MHVGSKSGCLDSFRPNRALIWMTPNCHCAPFWNSPERWFSSSLLVLSLLLLPQDLLMCVTCATLNLQPCSRSSGQSSEIFPSRYWTRWVENSILLGAASPAQTAPPVVAFHARGPACHVCCCIFYGLLFVTSGSAVIDYEIQRRAFGRHTSPLVRYLTTIDFLGPGLRCCIRSTLSSPWYQALLTTVSLSFHPP